MWYVIQVMSGYEHRMTEQCKAQLLAVNEVTVTSGSMKDWSGKVKKIDCHKKLAVLEMDFFGRTTDITVGLKIVEKKG